MADCIITRRGGGGYGGLNVLVVGGTTQPENPKENTVWVNTDTEIVGWSFSANSPLSPINGMVWMATDALGNIKINALQKNEIILQPNSAYQYIGGEWVWKEASIFVDGKWGDLINYVFKQGSILTYDEMFERSSGTMSNAAITEDGSFTLTLRNVNERHSVCVTKEPFVVTGERMMFEYSSHSNSNNYRFGIAETKVTGINTGIAQVTPPVTNGVKSTISLSVSGALGQEVYLYIGGANSSSITIHNIWFE